MIASSYGAAQIKWIVDTNKPESAIPAEFHASLIGGAKLDDITKIRFNSLSWNRHKLTRPHSTESRFSGSGSAGPFLTAWYYNPDTKTWTWRGCSKISNLVFKDSYVEATLSSHVGTQILTMDLLLYYWRVLLMAIPNNPELDQQWTNDETGVTYQWDGERWFIVSTEISDLEDKYVNRSGDTMTGGLTLTDANNLTFSKEDDSLQFAINPNVNIDYFTNIYAFEGDGIRFRVSQNQNTSSVDYDTLISLSGETHDIGGSEYRGKLALNRVRVPGTPDQATNKWYVDTADDDLQGQIDSGLETQGEILESIETLENKVNALEGSVIDATWSFEADNRAPRDGEFGLRANGVSATTWAGAQQILISFIDSYWRNLYV